MFHPVLGLIISLMLPFIRLSILPTFLSYLIHYCSQLPIPLSWSHTFFIYILSKSSHQCLTYSLFPLYDLPTSYHFNLDTLLLAWTTMTNRRWDSSKSKPQKTWNPKNLLLPIALSLMSFVVPPLVESLISWLVVLYLFSFVIVLVIVIALL